MSAGPPPENRGSDIPGTAGSGVHLLRELPLSTSVLWHPTSPTIVQRKPPSGPYPVFFEQKAIAAVHAHFETAGRQGMMGFLVGDLFESPTSHQRFVVVDQTIRLNQAVYGDKTLVIVSRLWDRIQEELKKTEGHLIGWYHSHPPITVELAPGDVETHLQYFKRPWHVALVLASEHEGPVAGLFRPKPGETSSSLPFYELLEEVEDGTSLAVKQSVLPWINFLTDDQAARHADGTTPLAVTPPPSPSALQFVKATPTPKPVAGIGSAVKPPPAPPAAPAKPAAPAPPPPAPAKPAALAPAPPAAPPKPAAPAPAQQAAPAKPAAPAPAPPAAPPKPAAPVSVAPVAPLAPAASVPQRPPAAPASTTGTVARPSLADRPQPPPAPAPPPPAAPAAPRRDTQMKSPPNALSNLPIVEAGGYQLGDVDSRASEPGVVRPRAQDAAPAEPQPRLGRLQRPALGAGRPITPKPFAPALIPRSDGHPGLFAFFVMAVIAGGGFAGWKYWWLPNHPPAAQPRAAAPSKSASPAPATPDSAKGSGTSSLATGLQPAAAPPVALDSPLVVLDRRADSVSTGVSAYDALVQAGRSGCDGLSQALVAMEDSWKTYNISKKRVGTIDGDRFTRDQRLYMAVDSVEWDFDRSGCTRP